MSVAREFGERHGMVRKGIWDSIFLEDSIGKEAFIGLLEIGIGTYGFVVSAEMCVHFGALEAGMAQVDGRWSQGGGDLTNSTSSEFPTPYRSMSQRACNNFVRRSGQAVVQHEKFRNSDKNIPNRAGQCCDDGRQGGSFTSVAPKMSQVWWHDFVTFAITKWSLSSFYFRMHSPKTQPHPPPKSSREPRISRGIASCLCECRCRP